MKKLFYFAAAAVALAACAKNEVIPVNSGENQEITFNVAPKTKADPAQDKDGHKEFGKGNVFASWAYYLPEGKTWDANSGENYVEPKEYISGAKISYNTTENVWKAEKSYYWPKDGGKLTFFAYSLSKGNLELNQTGEPSGFGCDATVGINGAIDLQTNSNTDFLVADIAKDRTSNESTYTSVSGVNGVPTLFRHQLSWIVFRVKAGNYVDKEFKLKSITFKGVYHAATYNQKVGFVPTSVNSDISYTKKEQLVPTTDYADVTVATTDHWLYIPQTFVKGSDAKTNAYIEVKYTITTSKTSTNTEGQKVKQDIVTEDVTKQIFLNPTKGTAMFEEWKRGKKYTINLTFTLDEILWDPAVQDWEDVTIGTDATQIIVG